MGHHLRLFVGARQALSPYLAIATHARIFSLRPMASIYVLPLDDDLHDHLHESYGTGEWLDDGLQLSSGDIAFAARASAGTALAYIETEYFGGMGSQAAVLWEHGALRLGPAVMTAYEARKRPQKLWPINAALRALGIEATDTDDEFQSFGLANFRSNDAIRERAHDVSMQYQ